MTGASPLISAEQLAAALAGPHRPVLLDVRWDLPTGDGRSFPGQEYYLAGHLPGAVFVDLDAELADPPSAAAGRHPLPSRERFAAAARRWGVRADSSVVAYDEVGGFAAARAWWLLRYFGFSAVQVLDGGLPAWVAAGFALATDDVVPAPGDWQPDAGGHLATLDADAAAEWARAGRLLDVRAGARYRGDFEPIDPRAGHIPGARSAPTGHNLVAPGGRFRDPEWLRDRYARHGVGVNGPKFGAYCGSGVTGAHTVLALATAGIDAALYPGSFSQWANDPAREVETGLDPYPA